MVSVWQQYSLEFENSRDYMDQLFSCEPEKCLEAVVFLKNAVIGSNKQKEAVIEMGMVPRLLQILQEKGREELLLETTATLTSLAKGTDDHIRCLIEGGTAPVLIGVIIDPRNSCKFVETALKALRSLFVSIYAPINLIYESREGSLCLISRMLSLAANGNSFSNQECVATILAKSCQNTENQNILCNYGAVETIGNLFLSPAYTVQVAALHWLAQISHQNDTVSTVVVTTSCGGKGIPDILTLMMSQDKTPTMQLAAAKCMTHLYRAGSICSEDKRIVYKTLPTLIRMCKKDREPGLRAAAADTLAYLTEIDTYLQQTASICDHIIPTLADLLKYQSSCISLIGQSPTLCGTNLSSSEPIACLTLGSHLTPSAVRKLEEDVKLSQEMKQASFKAFASLGANDEDIRKKIIETELLMEHIVNGLSDGNLKIRLAALRCLHSLSRSVQQLRTTFQDHAVWIPLRNLLHNAPDDVLTVASSTLCNLLLEFSPSKQHFLDRGAVDLLCGLSRREEPALRLNGVWALMNMAFQADQNVKTQILTSLGTDQIFRLLSDSDVNIVLKTLGLMRNLLSTKPHIDHIMNLNGKQIMDAVTLILDGNHSPEVKEQAICILANIADGESSKELIMSNEEVLKKLTNFMMDCNVKLQIAATFCVSNLIWNEEDGAMDRQATLREMGVQKLLQQLLSTSDTTLFDRVKTALQQFS